MTRRLLKLKEDESQKTCAEKCHKLDFCFCLKTDVIGNDHEAGNTIIMRLKNLQRQNKRDGGPLDASSTIKLVTREQERKQRSFKKVEAGMSRTKGSHGKVLYILIAQQNRRKELYPEEFSRDLEDPVPASHNRHG
ncbi:uncharacterized protein G2W53_042239 [Senna tora]|uniref:Uncharacterized protein n=1 Tax=Senna tora TaxID=362788 RepID=A0A834SIS6_9FABA|nr:uncharacterized protein G2W53_042239 [Senna tora]